MMPYVAKLINNIRDHIYENAYLVNAMSRAIADINQTPWLQIFEASPLGVACI